MNVYTIVDTTKQVMHIASDCDVQDGQAGFIEDIDDTELGKRERDTRVLHLAKEGRTIVDDKVERLDTLIKTDPTITRMPTPVGWEPAGDLVEPAPIER